MKITIAGGDERMNTVAEMFEKSGCVCEKIGFGKSDIEASIKNTSAIIFPIPYCKGDILNAPFSEREISIGEIFSLAGEDILLLGGNLPETSDKRIDYAKREDFLRQNAKITAEGAIFVAMNRLNTTICGSNTLVLGYGRIGEYLSELLRSLGARVTVVARRGGSRLQAEMNGLKTATFDDLEALFSNTDVVFNTIPSPIADEKAIGSLKPKTPFIDLASLPGGLSEVGEKFLGDRFIRALGLPGKYAPETAGRVIFETISEILRGKGVLI